MEFRRVLFRSQDMLFNLGLFHKREAKPAQWAVFDSVGKDEDDLIDDFEALGGLAAIGSATKLHRSMVCSYRFPSQETKLRAGHSATVPVADRSDARRVGKECVRRGRPRWSPTH